MGAISLGAVLDYAEDCPNKLLLMGVNPTARQHLAEGTADNAEDTKGYQGCRSDKFVHLCLLLC